jgi:hypothetical protein
LVSGRDWHGAIEEKHLEWGIRNDGELNEVLGAMALCLPCETDSSSNGTPCPCPKKQKR